jgi:DNA-binding LacI/PurR family transcriptional regulator
MYWLAAMAWRQDAAKKAGVSLMTVSPAFNDDGSAS